VALVAVLVVVVRVSSGGSSSGPVADVSGATTAATSPQGVLRVEAPNPDPSADAPCTSLFQVLPVQLEGDDPRVVQSASPYVRAWGDPPVVLVCGVAKPAGFTPSSGLIQINDVAWYVDNTTTKDTVVWTAVDRAVYVQVRVPASADSSSVTDLTAPIEKALPAQASSPGG
jgi:Protein of unknown function (DUF3515)